MTVSDKEVRDTYLKQNIKIKFDYAVISADDLRKTINPIGQRAGGVLQEECGALRAGGAGGAQDHLLCVYRQRDSGRRSSSRRQQEIQQYYNEHAAEYSVPEQAKSRHILISVACQAPMPKTDAAAKAKAQMVLKQLQAGGDWTELAKKYSDDPGSKDTGGELGFAQRGKMVPAFDNAIFTQKIGDIDIVKTQFGYHIVQVEERQAGAHAAAERGAGEHSGNAHAPGGSWRPRTTMRSS